MANQIDVDSWKQCEEEIKRIESEHSVSTGVWFRGHSNAAWRLETTLERRRYQHDGVFDYFKLISRLKHEIETFTDRAWELPSIQDLEQWCRVYDTIKLIDPAIYRYMTHLRHHGFPSPLLDWTRSPYIAAYFAFSAVPAGNDRVAIHVFCERPHGFKVEGGEDQPTILGLGPYVKTHKRHFLQQSAYTICVCYELNKGWKLWNHYAVFNLDQPNQDILWKITIPISERIPVLELLDRFNLNAYSLFGSEESLMETLTVRNIDLKK